MNRIASIKQAADKLSAGDREPELFVNKLLIELQKYSIGEQHVFMARIFENITHFSQAEQIALTQVPRFSRVYK